MKTSEFFMNNGFWHPLYEDKLPENVLDAYNMCVEHIIETSSCGDYLTHAGGEERGRLECCLCEGLFRRQIKPANREEGLILIKHLLAWHGLSDYCLRTVCIIANEIGEKSLVAKANMLLRVSNNDYVIGESPSSRGKLYNELFS